MNLSNEEKENILKMLQFQLKYCERYTGAGSYGVEDYQADYFQNRCNELEDEIKIIKTSLNLDELHE